MTSQRFAELNNRYKGQLVSAQCECNCGGCGEVRPGDGYVGIWKDVEESPNGSHYLILEGGERSIILSEPTAVVYIYLTGERIEPGNG